ncbi:retrovirus-related pol polyprotein from transposon TNT 1-94, partial [Tanacetum coccineum]
NTLDSLGKFDGKSDEGYFLGYSTSSKAFKVYNKKTKRVEENLHINFLEDQPNMIGTGPNWMFDLDFLTNSINYIPVSIENHVNVDADCTKKPSENASSDKDVQDLEDVADKEEQHQMQDNEKDLQDELEMLEVNFYWHLGYAGDIVPLLSAMLAGAAMDQGEGSAQPAEPHPTPVDPLPSTSLSPHQSPPHSPHQSPPHS